jgi:D-alanyl-D-alanine carboxypeptidase
MWTKKFGGSGGDMSKHSQWNTLSERLHGIIIPENQNERSKKKHVTSAHLQNIKHQKDWGKTAIISDFDTTLSNQLQNVLDSTMAVYNIIGSSASIMMPENGIWSGVYGFSNPETMDSVRFDMFFNIASCTKMYVATVMMRLVEEGLVSLDDSLHRWLPTFSNIDSTITIRQILTHSSGVSDFLRDNPAMRVDMISDFSLYWSPEHILSYVLEPDFEPGTSAEYSNTGFILAGMIIKAATGDSTFSQTLHEYVLNPLGLENTIVPLEEPLQENQAHGWYDYYSDNTMEDIFDNPQTSIWSSQWTAAAMMTTAEDLCRFTRLNYRGELLDPASMSEMLNMSYYGSIGVGLGIFEVEIEGEAFYGHGGNSFWYTSGSLYNPLYDFSVSVLVNQGPQEPDYPAEIAAEELAKAMLNYFTIDGLEDYNEALPKDFALLQNYPNPFNPTTVISYELKVKSNVDLSIYNLLGQKVATLVSKDHTAGSYQVQWDATGFSSGVYFYKLETDKGFVETKKLVLLN